MSLTNFELLNLAQTYNISLNGVYMKDELINIKCKNGFYVINIQSSTDGGGTHWTCLIINNNVNVYFDSFGASPHPLIINFCKRSNTKSYSYNNWIVQDLNSELCGWYCIALCLYINLHLHTTKQLYEIMNDYVNLFYDNTKLNANVLKLFYKNNILEHSILEKQILYKSK
jgi:hypothetical protein